MPCSSESIAQLAAALAKAQMELTNPIKTLTGVIDRWGSGAEGQTYRYAPLSAGLDIVRSSLCKHELAVIQTTYLEREAGLVMLTTTLAHGSGEWICATWPVCRMAEMTNPKLMGAALTYARRYGLFTLVGIAGDDDLDGPAELSELRTTESSGNGVAKPSVQPSADPQPGPTRRRRRDAGVPRAPREPSSAPKDALTELGPVTDSEGLLRWALNILPTRNRMTEASRASLDAAFLNKAQELEADPELLIAFGAPRSPAEHGNGHLA